MRIAFPLPIALLAGLIIAYTVIYSANGQYSTTRANNISPALPGGILNILGHNYLNQLIAEALFIKAAVYYGGLDQQINQKNLNIMEQHFISMAQLHPRLLDTYYRSESVLAHRGSPYINTANQILENGRKYLPNQVSLPFFEGFNYFHYLNNPRKAANILRIASSIPNAPQWIGHLASILIASDGNVRTGLIWLKSMHNSSQDKDEKARYAIEIIAFEKAMQVQLALERYAAQKGSYPKDLSALIPIYLERLPNFEINFQLVYQAPTLSLQRKPRE